MPYDRQLIAVIHPTNAPHLRTLLTGAKALKQAKGIRAMLLDPVNPLVPAEKQQAFGALTRQSRLYIIAHGGQTLGGSSPSELAEFLVQRCGLRNVGKIVLIACGSQTACRTVQAFHRALGEEQGVFTDVYGYMYPIKIIDAEDVKLAVRLSLPWTLGERRVMVGDYSSLADWKKPRDETGSKYICAWVGEESIREQVTEPWY